MYVYIHIHSSPHTQARAHKHTKAAEAPLKTGPVWPCLRAQEMKLELMTSRFIGGCHFEVILILGGFRLYGIVYNGLGV